MIKVVINACFGGFGLSEAGSRLYLQKIGKPCYAEPGVLCSVYWTVPESERVKMPDGAEWHGLSPDQRKRLNELYRQQTFADCDVPRDDANLVAVVEELGAAANGQFSKLKVVEIPDDADWKIEEYEGYEHVAEKHRTWR